MTTWTTDLRTIVITGGSGTFWNVPNPGCLQAGNDSESGYIRLHTGSSDRVDIGEQQDGTLCGVVRQSGSDEKYNPGL